MRNLKKSETYDLDQKASKQKGMVLKTIPFFERYVISSCGKHIFRRRIKKDGFIDLGERKIIDRPHGYKGISLYSSKNGKSTSISVARLVLFAHVGIPDTPGMEADHKDNNPSNNHVDNLQWLTKAENNARKVKQGRQVKGESCYKAKLTNEQAQSAFNLMLSSPSVRDISIIAGVSVQSLYELYQEKTWKHLNTNEAVNE